MADRIPASCTETPNLVGAGSAIQERTDRRSKKIRYLEMNIWYKLLQRPKYRSAENSQIGRIRPVLASVIEYFIFCLEANPDLLPSSVENPRSMVLDVSKHFSGILKTYLFQTNCDTEKLLQNVEFQYSLLALCLELHFFVRRISDISFENVLDLLEVPDFDFWKQVNYFAMVYHSMPVSCLIHLKKINNRIINETAWKESSFIFASVSHAFNSGAAKRELSQYGFNQFFKKLMKHMKQKIKLVCSFLGFSIDIQTDLWEKSRYFVSEHTQFLKDKTIDTVLICSLYFVCKDRCDIPLKKLLEMYKKACGLDRIDKGNDEYGLLNVYLNSTYLLAMKYFTKKQSLKIQEFHDDCGGNRTSSFVQSTSSIITPRPVKLCDIDSKENPFVNSNSRRFNKSNDYQLPSKKAKTSSN